MSRLFSGTAFDKPEPCARCGKLPVNCRCMELPEKRKMSVGKGGVKLDSGLVLTPENSRAPADQVARVSVQKKNGRVVTVISGLDHPANDLAKLCTELRQALATGGSVQGRTIELQGDQRERAGKLLEGRKMRVRVV